MKQAMIAAVPEVIQKGKQIGFSSDWKTRGYDTFVFAGPVAVDGRKTFLGVIVNQYQSEMGNKFYVHEVCDADGGYLVMDEAGNITKKRGDLYTGNRTC